MKTEQREKLYDRLEYHIQETYQSRGIETLFLRAKSLSFSNVKNILCHELNLTNNFNFINSEAFTFSQENPFIILIDGINENKKPQQLFNSILNFASLFPKGSLKFVLSYRIDSDNDYPVLDKAQEHLIYPTNEDSKSINSDILLKKYAIILSPFNRIELDSAWKSYIK